jgi:hypothetical protein
MRTAFASVFKTLLRSAALTLAAALVAVDDLDALKEALPAAEAFRADDWDAFFRSAPRFVRDALALRFVVASAVSNGALTERLPSFVPAFRICVRFAARRALFAVSAFDGLTVFLADLIGAPFHVPLWRRNDK